MRVALETHGCRLNQAESDSMASLLQGAGHEIVNDVSEAEVLLLNSCAITHRADADARRAVRRARRANPEVRVALTGCWAEAEPREALALEGVDQVFGNADKGEVVSRLAGAVVPVSSLRRRTEGAALPAAPSRRRTRALLKVQDGCDYRCAFCIVPSVRGPSRSLPLHHLVDETRKLVRAGVPEIVVTGIHLGTWGRDLSPRRNVADLVEGLLPGLGRARLRLSSLDPHEVDDRLVALMADHPDRICRHLHLPTQSLDDGVLRAMRRPHTAVAFEDTVHRLRARVPGVALGTDIIVGFPGEDAAAFEATAARLAALPLAYLHVFPYSVRRGTPAASMADQVDPAVRRERAERLSELSRTLRARFEREQSGRLADAVVYRQPAAGGQLRALTDNYVEVALEGPRALLGQRVRLTLGAPGEGARVVA